MPAAAGSETAWIESTTTRRRRRVVPRRSGRRGQIGGGEHHEPGGQRPEALGPPPHLLGRLLGRDEQHRRAPAGHRRQDLEQQRRLPHARLAAEQGDRARDEPAPEHPVELGQARGTGPDWVGSTASRGSGPGAASTGPGPKTPVGEQVQSPRGASGRGHGLDDLLLDEAVPLAARRAPPRPARRRRSRRRRHRCTVRGRPMRRDATDGV